MIRCLLLLAIALLCGCNRYTNTSYSPLACEMTKFYGHYAYSMIYKYGIWVYNANPAIGNNVHTLHFQLVTPRKVPLEQARSMLVLAAITLWSEVNDHPKFQPFISPYLGWENMLFGITFVDKNRSHVTDPDKMYSVSFQRGTLVYRTYDPETRKPKIIHRETIEEARQILSTFSPADWDWSLLDDNLLTGMEAICASDQFQDFQESSLHPNPQ